jgi:pimeloyl-ACP methyl ester carboxylesterase
VAAVVCAPLGHEYLRGHFVLQRLARRLADANVPTLRFDYFGCGDSLGTSREASCARWQSDILAAADELRRKTGARRLIGVGVRLGATLLATVCGRYDFEKLVLWDPVDDGSQHVSALADAHRQHLRSRPMWRLPRLPFFDRGDRELLGVTYSAALVRELRELRLPRAEALSCPIRILRTDSPWLDVAELEDMLSDVGTSSALARLVQEAA